MDQQSGKSYILKRHATIGQTRSWKCTRMSSEIDKQRSTNFGTASPFLKLTQVRPRQTLRKDRFSIKA